MKNIGLVINDFMCPCSGLFLILGSFAETWRSENSLPLNKWKSFFFWSFLSWVSSSKYLVTIPIFWLSLLQVSAYIVARTVVEQDPHIRAQVERVFCAMFFKTTYIFLEKDKLTVLMQWQLLPTENIRKNLWIYIY